MSKAAVVIDRLRGALAERYTVERELGSGGMTAVYLAEDLKHHRKVAIKILKPELAALLGPERFLREIETSNESGRGEVYLRTFPDAERGVWQISQSGGSEPAWRPDGKELFFWSGNQFTSVNVNTAPEFWHDAPRVLFEGDQFKRWASSANYDVHPDGDDFLMIVVAVEADIAVVLNWVEEVDRLMTGGND